MAFLLHPLLIVPPPPLLKQNNNLRAAALAHISLSVRVPPPRRFPIFSSVRVTKVWKSFKCRRSTILDGARPDILTFRCHFQSSEIEDEKIGKWQDFERMFPFWVCRLKYQWVLLLFALLKFYELFRIMYLECLSSYFLTTLIVDIIIFIYWRLRWYYALITDIGKSFFTIEESYCISACVVDVNFFWGRTFR